MYENTCLFGHIVCRGAITNFGTNPLWYQVRDLRSLADW